MLETKLQSWTVLSHRRDAGPAELALYVPASSRSQAEMASLEMHRAVTSRRTGTPIFCHAASRTSSAGLRTTAACIYPIR